MNNKSIVKNIIIVILIVGGIILIANLFIFLLPIFFFIAIVYYLYIFFFKGKVNFKMRNQETNKSNNKKHDDIKEAEVINEKFDE